MNYYATLGLERSASADEIKSAYRKLAMKHHPDRGGDEKKFQEITEAYETLGDPNKKAFYDQGGHQPQGNPFGQGFHEFHSNHPFQGGAFGGGHPFEDIFAQFGFGFQNTRPKNSDLQIKVKISLKDSYMGKTTNISYRLPSGRDQTVDINIPPGVENGQNLKMSNMGDDSIKELPRGDLIVHIEVEHDIKFQRNDLSLITSLNIDIFDAMLGCKRKVTNIDGSEIEIDIKSGTQNGQTYSCKGLGFKSIRQHNLRGDLLIKVNVKTPIIKDSKSIELIKNLAAQIRNNQG